MHARPHSACGGTCDAFGLLAVRCGPRHAAAWVGRTWSAMQNCLPFTTFFLSQRSEESAFGPRLTFSGRSSCFGLLVQSRNEKAKPSICIVEAHTQAANCRAAPIITTGVGRSPASVICAIGPTARFAAAGVANLWPDPLLRRALPCRKLMCYAGTACRHRNPACN